MPYVDDDVGYGALDHDFSSYDEGLKQSGKRRRLWIVPWGHGPTC
jgi:hypothetical protein